LAGSFQSPEQVWGRVINGDYGAGCGDHARGEDVV
jgi:hypothetical protein